jgi:signal transduction histidine kinase
MAELENKDKIDREELLDRLEIMYDKSRDISYEVEDEAEQEVAFHLVVSDLLKSFSNEYRTVLIAGNDQAVWDLCSSNLKINIEEILQELMVNMQKHSRAGEVIIRFDYDGSNLLIFYKDNGIGMPEDKKFGNGLSNTENRINNLKGKITFEKQFENGLGINIEIPINK